MYRIYESQSIIHIEIDCNISLEFFPYIKKTAYFENNVHKKFMLKAQNVTQNTHEAQVIVKSTKDCSSHKPKILFCANRQDLIEYIPIFDSVFDICPVNVFEFEAIDFVMPSVEIKEVFFSSKRAFDFFIRKVGINYLCDKQILAVGKKTAQVIEQFGFKVSYPQIYRSSELDLKNVLVVCPKEHAAYDKDAIVLEVYKTKMADDIAYYTYDCDFDFAMFTSPLSFEFLIQAGFEEYIKCVKNNIICIGTSTQKAVEKFGYSCIIPKEFTIEGMFKLLEALY